VTGTRYRAANRTHSATSAADATTATAAGRTASYRGSNSRCPTSYPSCPGRSNEPDRPRASAAQSGGPGGLDAAQAAARETVPAGRLGTVEEFAAAAAFLCSAPAGYITGTTLVVDGGLTAATGIPDMVPAV